MEIWQFQYGIQWQRQQNLAKMARTHDSISPWPRRGSFQAKMLLTHGTQVPIYATCQPSWSPLAISPLRGKMTPKWGRMATHPKLGDSQFSPHEERSHGDTPHSMQVYVPSPNCPSPWSSGSRNLGPNIKGETGFVAIPGKTAKIHPKVVTRKIVSLYHKRDRPWAFAWVQTEALLPFCDKGWGSKR